VAYRVENMIAIKITDMSLIGEVIDEAAEEGANRIQRMHACIRFQLKAINE